MKNKARRILSAIFFAIFIFVAVIGVFIFANPIVCYGPSYECMRFASLQTAVDAYYLDYGKLPDRLENLVSGSKRQYYDNIPQDSWGNNIVYLTLGPGREQVVFLSYGADGELGGEGDNQDIMSNSELCSNFKSQ